MTTSKKDVILCRGIWYVTILLSIIGLSISLNLLWPSTGNSLSRFLRDGAVSVTTIFYAVTLLSFFIDPPSTTYKEYLTDSERLPQFFVSYYALTAVIGANTIVNCKCRRDNSLSCKEFGMSVSLFVVSLFSGGLGLIQLSDKLRMEIRHALFTLFLAWLFCLLGIALGFCIHDHPKLSVCIVYFQVFLICVALSSFNFSLSERVHPLPA